MDKKLEKKLLKMPRDMIAFTAIINAVYANEEAYIEGKTSLFSAIYEYVEQNGVELEKLFGFDCRDLLDNIFELLEITEENQKDLAMLVLWLEDLQFSVKEKPWKPAANQQIIT